MNPTFSTYQFQQSDQAGNHEKYLDQRKEGKTQTSRTFYFFFKISFGDTIGSEM